MHYLKIIKKKSHKLFNSLKARSRDPQLQVNGNYSDLSKWSLVDDVMFYI